MLFWTRSLLIWLVMMLVETVNGTLRNLLLAPAVGDPTARRIGFFTGMLLIFLTALLLIRWPGADSTRSLLMAGLLWAFRTLMFEFAVGSLVLGYSRSRLLEDYDVPNGGLMIFGLIFMIFVPYLAARMRGPIRNAMEA